MPRAFRVALVACLTTVMLGSAAPAVAAPTESAPGSATPGASYLQWVKTLHPIPWDARFYTGPEMATIPVDYKGPTDADGLPMERWKDGKLYYKPSGMAIWGMSQLSAFLQTGNIAHLDDARRVANKLISLADHRRSAWWLPFEFNYHFENVAAPWYNAYAQGLALALFSRLYEKLGEAKYLNAAQGVFRSFQRFGPAEPWHTYVTKDGHLWFEHYPGPPADHVISAHIYAVVGLVEYWQVTGDSDAAQIIYGGLATIHDKLHGYRRAGRIAWYDALHRSAIPVKHLHVIQNLHRLAIATGSPWFTRMEGRWQSDYDIAMGT